MIRITLVGQGTKLRPYYWMVRHGDMFRFFRTEEAAKNYAGSLS